jgi:hypothetical protein
MRSPLGTSVRITYTAVVEIGRREEIEKLVKNIEHLRAEVICGLGVDALYRLSLLDPDAVDVMRSCGNECCALVVSAQ